MGTFWVRFVELFGLRATSQYGEVVPESWVVGLADVPGRLLVIGLERCRRGEHEPDPSRRGWPPNLVAFRALCEPRPEDYGLPADADAYREAVLVMSAHGAGEQIRPSHPAVWHAACQTGPGLLAADEQTSRRLFLEVWRLTVPMVMRGEKLTEIPQRLPPPPVVRKSAEELAAILAAADEKLAAAGIRTRAAQ